MSKHNDEEENVRIKVAKLITGGLFFFLGLFFENKGLNDYYFKTLYLLSYIILGFDVFKEAIENTLHGEVFDENFLMTVAIIGAALLGDYREAVAVMFFYMIGESAQDAAVDSSVRNIEKTMKLMPEKAHLVENGNTIDVNPNEILVGQIVRVIVGEKVPVDGKLVDGTFLGDVSSLTGESLPVEFTKESRVLAGTIVLNSTVDIVCDTEFENNTVSKILDQVSRAKANKAKVENFITKFARIYTPVVIFFAVLLALVPSLLTGAWKLWSYRALEFLVISCPCALVISIPLTFFAGIGGCAKAGILVKGSNHLEILSKVSAFAFDKTGTITTGKFQVRDFIIIDNTESNKNFLSLVLGLEKKSNHPLAKAIVSYIEEKGIREGIVKNSEEIPGLGLKGHVVLDDREFEVKCGNSKLVENQIKTQTYGSVINVSIDGKFCGYFIVSDVIKNGADKALSLLKKMGISKTIMLTGDRQEVAQKVADQLGFDEQYSELLPQDKVACIERLRRNHVTAFVGDGINDAPVLMASDIGLSMGSGGSDSAIQASGIVIAKDEIEKIPLSLKIARKTVRIAKQNITFSLAVKVLFLGLSAFGLTSMAFAVFADVGVCLICIINSLRALKS